MKSWMLITVACCLGLTLLLPWDNLVPLKGVEQAGINIPTAVLGYKISSAVLAMLPICLSLFLAGISPTFKYPFSAFRCKWLISLGSICTAVLLVLWALSHPHGTVICFPVFVVSVFMAFLPFVTTLKPTERV